MPSLGRAQLPFHRAGVASDGGYHVGPFAGHAEREQAHDPEQQTQRATPDRAGNDVAPGDYDVVIESPGYEPQRRKVHVDPQGVVILNADLAKKR